MTKFFTAILLISSTAFALKPTAHVDLSQPADSDFSQPAHVDFSQPAHVSMYPSDDFTLDDSSAFHNPAFTNPEIFQLEFVDEPDWSRDLLSQYAEIRVKVFPHNNRYNSPQGKDTTIDRVTLNSAAQCNVYKADRPTSEGGITRSELIRTGTSFNLSVQNVTDPIWIECEAPIQVTRVDYPSAPIRYRGVMFVKKTKTAVPYITVVNVVPFESLLSRPRAQHTSFLVVESSFYL